MLTKMGNVTAPASERTHCTICGVNTLTFDDNNFVWVTRPEINHLGEYRLTHSLAIWSQRQSSDVEVLKRCIGTLRALVKHSSNNAE